MSMITIPLNLQFTGTTPKPLKDSPVRRGGGGRYDRSNVVTPPFISMQVEDTIRFTEEEEAKLAAKDKIKPDPYENIKPLRDFSREPIPDVVMAPLLEEAPLKFGTMLSPVRTKRFVNFELSKSASSYYTSPRRISNDASRDIATRLGLTLFSDTEHSSGAIIGSSGVRSMLPSVALAPIRGSEPSLSEDQFTNSPPTFLHHPSLDCFGIGNFNDDLRTTFDRTRLHTPTDVRQKVARIKAEQELQERIAAMAELDDIRRQNQLPDIGGALCITSRSTKGDMSTKSSATSSRRNSSRYNGSSSRTSPVNASLHSRPPSKLTSASPIPGILTSHPHSHHIHHYGHSHGDDNKGHHQHTPDEKSSHDHDKGKDKAGTHHTGADHSEAKSKHHASSPELNSNTGRNSASLLVGKQPSPSDLGETKFYFSENEAQHKQEKLERRNALLEKRKADTVAKAQRLLEQKTALTSATKSHKAVVTDMIIEASAETRETLEKFVGNNAKRALSKMFYNAVNELSKYPHDSQLPESKRLNPRYMFVREQAKRGQHPLQLLIRDESTMNGVCLGGKGLGDEKILPVVLVLDLLPAVHIIDFHDNRLTDISLMPLAQKLLGLKHLVHLDLSFNKIDDSSATIMAYLRSSECKLQTLYLNGADVDDGECGNLMDAISENRTITKLGLSNNLIGKAEPYNTVYPDLITGGEAIGAMLLENSTIKSLDLSWNAIRLASSETLAESLNTNSTLMVLNLEHNSFGDMGTQILGFALKSNHTLLDLNLSYNSLVPRSASVLANALSYNDTLTMLNLDGNIIGNVGMQSLVAAIQRSAGDNRVLKISFENCDCKKHDPDLFNASNPDGIWDVDLSTPYGRMVAEECFFLANFRAGCNLNKLTYNGHVVKLHRKVDDADIGKYPVDEYHELCIRAATDLLANKIKEAATILSNILSRQFAFNMPVPVGVKVLSHVKEHWDEKMELNVGNPIADVRIIE